MKKDEQDEVIRLPDGKLVYKKHHEELEAALSQVVDNLNENTRKEHPEELRDSEDE